MAAFVATNEASSYRSVPAGAESNVVVGMALLGHRVAWVSRLGTDPLGRLIADEIASTGVVVEVTWDPARPTGVMTKHPSATGTQVGYYRRGSAASALAAADRERVPESRLLHLTGITPALSASAAALVESLVAHRLPDGPAVSFDVNYRPALWSGPTAAVDHLLPIMHAADIVFVGDDEAEELLGTSDPDRLRALLIRRNDQEFVLKQGAVGATRVTQAGAMFEPALTAVVVDVTGAGDAFAAGYLSGLCRGWEPRAQLRLGHLMGAGTVGVLDDVAPPPPAEALEAISGASSVIDMSTRVIGRG